MDKKVLIGIGVVVVVGAVLGLGVAGVIPIPGLSKKPAAAAKEEKPAETREEKPPAVKSKDNKTDKVATTAATTADPKDKPAGPTPAELARGYKKLAAVWAEMTPEDVGKLLVDHYKPEDAAPILKLMDEEQVAAIFTALSKSEPAPTTLGAPPKKADNPTANYCEALAKEVSKPATTDASKS